MIIDAHTHIIKQDWLPDKWWDELSEFAAHALKDAGITKEVIREAMLPTFEDPEGTTIIREMDSAGINRSLIFPLDYENPLGASKASIEEQNKGYAYLQERYSDRLIAFASVDPRRANACELLEKFVKEWKMKGLKLHPSCGFYPNGKETYRLLEKASELGLKAIIFHTGQIVSPLYSKYCDPIYLDDLLVDFPHLTIMAAHMSFGWCHQLFHMGATKLNLVTDFSGWQPVAKSHYPHFCKTLREALDEFGSDRVLFGTDGPYLRATMPDKDYVQLIKDLPTKAPDGIEFTQEEVDAILGGNAQRIFEISE